MNSRFRISLFLCLILGVLECAVAQNLPEKHFYHPDRVRYDKDCFTIEGEDVFVLSAAFHYFRCPQELWKDRFQKIKEAGFNTVETYVPWNWHERNMPKDIDDYSQCNFDDLKAWLKMAHEEFGFYTIVRPGPFICAEWAGGAYPRWLAKYCPETYDTSFWLRSNHPEHTKWAQHWYNAVCKVFKNEQITHKKRGEKGIIMVQLENEYIYFDMESSKKIEFLKALSASCITNGIDVPLFTCVTPEVRGSKDQVVSQLFDMDNQYVWWNMHEAKSRLEKLKEEQPNAPAFVCELQGGWFSTVGGRLSEDSYLDGRHARGMALMGMAGGATGLNYYMFFGGTHFAGWGARRMTTTYDYGAPLKENGGVGEKYAAVKGIGEIIQRFGDKIVRSQPVAFESEVDLEPLTIGVRQAPDKTMFFFFLNKDKKKEFNRPISLKVNGEVIQIACQLGALDSKVFVVSSDATGLQQSEWYPKEQALPKRPATLPKAIRVLEAYKQNETDKGEWKELSNETSLPEIAVNDCRYVRYRSKVTLTEEEIKSFGSLVFEMYTGDPIYVEVNGELTSRTSKDELENTFILGDALHAGENNLFVIYENRGHAHGYKPMEELSGLKQAGFGQKQSDIIPIEEWYVKTPEGTNWEKIMLNQQTIDNLSTLQIAGLEKPLWPAAWILQEKSGQAIYKTTIRWTKEMIDNGLTALDFRCIDDQGTLFVNGVEVAKHDHYDEPFICNIAQYIKPGDNLIEMLVSNQSGAGGILKGVRLKQEFELIKEIQWQVSTDLGGIQQGWTRQAKAKGDWKITQLTPDYPLTRKGKIEIVDQPTNMRNALLTWYRIEFDLPKQPLNTWIPWKMILNATGTGYMWLNGENIGRYWEEGPQREFYLPECWLRFNKKNVIVLGLRESELNGSQLFGVEIAPYTEDAEVKIK